MRGDRNRWDAAAVFALEPADLLEQPETVLTWHRQVRHDRVHAYRLHDGQCVPRVPSLQDVGAELLQRGAEDFEHVLVVVHDQDVNVGEVDRTNLRSVGSHAGRMRNIGTNAGTEVIFDI